MSKWKEARCGALWYLDFDKGSLKGEILLPGTKKKRRVVMLANSDKRNDRQPDFSIFCFPENKAQA